MTEEKADQPTQINVVSGWERLGLILLAGILKIWQSTLSYSYSSSDFEQFTDSNEGGLILTWHNRLFTSLGVFRHLGIGKDSMHGLVSASKDGAKLAVFMEAIGLNPIRGSSSKRAQQATRELLAVLGKNKFVAITMDGPRGPCYIAQPGGALLAMKSNKPIYLLSGEASSCWRLKSWDRFILPKPFSEVRIKMDRIDSLPDAKGKEGRQAVQQIIQERLMSITKTL